MTFSRTVALLAAASLFLLPLAGCQGGSGLDPAFVKAAREGCTPCHGPSRWEGQTYTREAWKEIVDDMVARGARLTDEQYRVIVEKGPVK